MARRETFLKRIFRLTNNRIRLGVGLVLAAMFCIQCVQPAGPSGNTLIAESEKDIRSPGEVKRLEKLARSDHVALLRLALEHYRRRVRAYTCTFIKQERINGKLKPEQWIKVKFMEKPFSVSMHWVKNVQTGDRALYVAGKYNGQMLIRLAGVLRLFGTVTRDPASPQVMANTLRPITMFGFRRSLENLLKVYEPAVKAGDAVCRFAGRKNLAGREVLVLERVLPPKEGYPARKTTVYLDAEWLVPLGVEGYDWDGQLTCRYLYKDVDFAAALTEKDFTPQANEMTPPKP